jgi:predicted Zn-dependent protease
MAHIQLQHGIANIMHHRLIENLGQERTRIIQNSRIETQHQTFAEFVNKIIETLLIGGFSQLQEFEADSFAFTLLRITGYDAVSLIELLGMLERQNQNKIGNLNTSHPLPAQRIANLERQIPVHRMTRNNFVRMDRFNRIMGRNLQ